MRATEDAYPIEICWDSSKTSNVFGNWYANNLAKTVLATVTNYYVQNNSSLYKKQILFLVGLFICFLR